jgi:16S rRNA (uracil1498-N3)-methyltransferase
MSVPRVFLPAITAADRVVALPAADSHHLVRVLRMKSGDEVRVFDGRGHEWTGRLTGSSASSAAVEIVGEVTPAEEPAVRVTLAVGLLPRDQMDAVIRDATMLGAWSIVPMVTARVSVPERAWRSGGAITRWRRVAVASARQCGRAVVPTVGAVTPFDTLLHLTVGSSLIMCVEPGPGVASVDVAAKALPRPTSALVLVGPEGGWSGEELDVAVKAGATTVQLGPRILRAEVAPTVILTALWTSWGW